MPLEYVDHQQEDFPLEPPMCDRATVYKAIDSERDYQQKKWRHIRGEHELKESQHPVSSWILFMEEYLARARRFSTGGETGMAHVNTMSEIRKVAALAVACMEHRGTCLRTPTEKGA